MDNEVFFTGRCSCCGQQRILEHGMDNQDAADEAATMSCTCEDGYLFRQRARE